VRRRKATEAQVERLKSLERALDAQNETLDHFILSLGELRREVRRALPKPTNDELLASLVDPAIAERVHHKLAMRGDLRDNLDAYERINKEEAAKWL
jgi:hypothetical protein